MYIESEIINWYKKNKRDLPWRNTKNPYEIWISEVILQQTRVNQAIGYYYIFLENFPDVQALANASEYDILKVWQGLGYYSRARNLHSSAKYIVDELRGVFPQSYLELLKLKGIGNYTAAAIASFAFNEKVAVVDGNVFRVLSRLYAESTPINSAKGKKLFFDLATKLIENQEPYIFNQAIMEFGAMHCTVKSPDCPNCVVKEHCLAYNQQNVLFYPVKNKLQKKRNRFLTYFFIENNGFTYLKKRGDKDIWQGLYEFPHIESTDSYDLVNLMDTSNWRELFIDVKYQIIQVWDNVRHQLTHQQLDIVFISIKIYELNRENNFLDNVFLKIPIRELSKYPVPKPIENYIKQM